MLDALLMSCFETFRDLLEECKSLISRNAWLAGAFRLRRGFGGRAAKAAASLDALCQSLSRHELQCQGIHTIGFLEFVGGGDVGMIE